MRAPCIAGPANVPPVATTVCSSKTVPCIAGPARFLRLLHKLRVTEVDQHAQLLLAVGAASPSMAADYLSSCSLNLEPKEASVRWLISMKLIGQMVECASEAPAEFLLQANR